METTAKFITDEELNSLVIKKQAELNELISEKNRRADQSTKLKYNDMAKMQKLIEIARQNPQGFTVDKDTLEPITEGYAVAVSETQNSFDIEGLGHVIEESKKTWIDAIGGWMENGQYYYDAVMIVDAEEDAAELGYRNRQKAIFNLSTKEPVYLK